MKKPEGIVFNIPWFYICGNKVAVVAFLHNKIQNMPTVPSKKPLIICTVGMINDYSVYTVWWFNFKATATTSTSSAFMLFDGSVKFIVN